ncbi:DNA-binding helix-turn-helix protein [Leptospira inadai serovar Lyme str. 10]|uniref:DNA-binding helix-turn-helix protein n=2 Tax=Leptospira inadai serovar Lyme TaxID=293084 RepID=V6H7Z0_9LEPT|nr:helix-turn-helix domain-containing protein [Leptospira inadai]EQA34891.1 DNA-binding helix-turn-helix protein [Leptospira inadai serovar Lyme str. 10]PNV72462.1 AraC family transcriptional regulator [Leptospira inadai serovar Lyme]
MIPLLQEIVFFGAIFCLLLGIGALLRPERTVTFKILFLLSFSVSVQFFYVYFLLKEIYFEPSFLNHLHIPFAWVLGPGMYSLFSVTVQEYTSSRSEIRFYLPGILLLLGFPFLYLISPELFTPRPIDYFAKGNPSWLDILLILAYIVNLVYYLIVVWKTRTLFRLEHLKTEAGARILLYIILGSGSITTILITSYIIRDLDLLFIATVSTIFYAVVGYLAQLSFPQIFHEIGPSVREAYRNSRLEGMDLQDLGTRLSDLMNREKLYLDEDLSLASLSIKLDVKPYQLSEYLNQHRKTNFSRFVNGYRVEEAILLLKRENGANILSVAYRSGFNSKATFNLAFKSVTGVSPRDYIRTRGQKTSKRG